MTSGRQSDVRGTQGHDGHDSMGEPRVNQDPAPNRVCHVRSVARPLGEKGNGSPMVLKK